MPNDINPPNNFSIFICQSSQFDFWAERRAGVQYSPPTLNCPRRQENAEATFARRVDLWGRRSHTRKTRGRPRGWLRRSNRGARRATQRPLIAGRSNTGVRRPAISAPATLLAPRVALRFSLRHPIVQVGSRTNIRRLGYN